MILRVVSVLGAAVVGTSALAPRAAVGGAPEARSAGLMEAAPAAEARREEEEEEGEDRRLLMEAAPAAEEESMEMESLRAEVRQLRRELYLLNMRKNNCPVGQTLGEWHAPNHPGIEENYAICYPQQLKAGFCMNGYRKGAPVTPSMMRCDSVGGEWQPPPNPRHNKAPEAKRRAAARFLPLADGFSLDPTQFPTGLYENMYFDITTGDTQWRAENIQMLLFMLKDGQDISPRGYPEAMKDLMGGMAMVPGTLVNKTVLVVGSVSPWVESIALHMGAKEVTTADYALASFHDDMATHVPQLKRGRLLPEMLADANVEQYDVILSYSSIEHDGLGRYGDPVFADGDLSAMREIYLLLKPGGTLVLGVPSEGADGNYYYSERRYGPVRFPVLTRGWNYQGSICDGKFNSTFVLERHDRTGFSRGFGIHSVVLLEKPSDAPEILDYLYEEEDCVMKCTSEAARPYCWASGRRCRAA